MPCKINQFFDNTAKSVPKSGWRKKSKNINHKGHKGRSQSAQKNGKEKSCRIFIGSFFKKT
jgi:hypothetical protein